MSPENRFQHQFRSEVGKPEYEEAIDCPVANASTAPPESPASEQQDREDRPSQTRQRNLSRQTLRPNVLDKEESAEECERKNREARSERREHAGFKRLHRRENR